MDARVKQSIINKQYEKRYIFVTLSEIVVRYGCIEKNFFVKKKIHWIGNCEMICNSKTDLLVNHE